MRSTCDVWQSQDWVWKDSSCIPTIQNLAQSDIRTVPRGLILVPTATATQVKEELDPLA